MRTLIFLITTLFALTACESKLDTCLATEIAANEEALRKANPIYQAYAAMDAYDGELEGYYRALHTRRIELDSGLGPEDRKCDMAPTSDCTKAQQELYATLEAHIEQAGYSDVDAAINALWEMQEKHASAKELEQVMAAGDAVAGDAPTEDDIESWVKHEVTAYRTERDYHLNKIVQPKLTAAASRQASQLCSSGGQ